MKRNHIIHFLTRVGVQWPALTNVFVQVSFQEYMDTLCPDGWTVQES